MNSHNWKTDRRFDCKLAQAQLIIDPSKAAEVWKQIWNSLRPATVVKWCHVRWAAVTQLLPGARTKKKNHSLLPMQSTVKWDCHFRVLFDGSVRMIIPCLVGSKYSTNALIYHWCAHTERTCSSVWRCWIHTLWKTGKCIAALLIYLIYLRLGMDLVKV